MMNSRYAKIGDFQNIFSALLDTKNITRLKVAVATFELFVELVKSCGEAQHLLQRPQNAFLRRLFFRDLPILLKVSISGPGKNDVTLFALVNTS